MSKTTEVTEGIIEALEAYDDFDGDIITISDTAFMLFDQDTKELYKVTIKKESK